MTKHERTIAVRVPEELFKKIERFRAKVAKKNPGVSVRQSDAVRALLEMALVTEPP